MNTETLLNKLIAD